MPKSTSKRSKESKRKQGAAARKLLSKSDQRLFGLVGDAAISDLVSQHGRFTTKKGGNLLSTEGVAGKLRGVQDKPKKKRRKSTTRIVGGAR